MKMSTFQAILFSIFGLGAVIGIFVFATYTGKSGQNSIGAVTIWGTLPKDQMSALLVDATKLNQSLKEVTYVEKSPATIISDLAAAIATGSAPDLIIDSQENLYSLQKFLSPIPPATLPANTFTSTFIGGGNIYSSASGYLGVPFLVDPLVLIYNRSILSSSGIAKPPATWEELTGLVPSVATLTPTKQITRSFIALGTYNNVRNARGILSALFMQTGSPMSVRSSTGLISANIGTMAQSGVPPGQAVVSFYTQFADPSKVSYTWNASLPDSQKAFLSGDLALYLGYVSEARYFAAANPNLNAVVATLPQPGTAQNRSAYGRIYAMMIPRGARNAAGAYQAAALLSGPATQALAAADTGLAPANVNVLASGPANASDATAAVAYSEALYTSGWLSPAGAETDNVFSVMITDVITGRSSLDFALGNAERSLTALLRQ